MPSILFTQPFREHKDEFLTSSFSIIWLFLTRRRIMSYQCLRKIRIWNREKCAVHMRILHHFLTTKNHNFRTRWYSLPGTKLQQNFHFPDLNIYGLRNSNWDVLFCLNCDVCILMARNEGQLLSQTVGDLSLHDAVQRVTISCVRKERWINNWFW